MLVFDRALAWVPYPRLAAWASRQPRRRQSPRATPEVQGLEGREVHGREVEAEIRHLGRLVDGVARNHWKPMGCLRRSLCLQAMLARRGVATSLRFGIAPGASLEDREGLEAHAWLEWRGRPINDREDVAERYLPLSPARSFGVEAPGAS